MIHLLTFYSQIPGVYDFMRTRGIPSLLSDAEIDPANQVNLQMKVKSSSNVNEHKRPASGKLGKEAATDVPSWARGNRP